MFKGNFQTAWMNIDQTDDPRHFVRMMDRARGGNDGNPAQYEVFAELIGLREGYRVLDVGCGTGGAARVLATRVGGSGKVIGLDNSQTMIDEAKSRADKLNLPVEFQKGSAYGLPFPDNSFDASYALRFFEIIANPSVVLKEMFRVTRPGGRIYVNGPDIDMWTFDVADRSLTRRFVHYVCDREVNGWIGRQLPRLLTETGLVELKVSTATEYLPNFTLMHEVYLRDLVERANHAGVVSGRASRRWIRDLQTGFEAGHFPCSQTFFRVAGEKPI